MKKKMIMKNQKGVAVVELAIVLPLLLLLAFGIIEGSLLLYNKQVITNASREGARAGIAKIYGGVPVVDTAKVQEIVESYCLNRLVTFGTPNAPQVDLPSPDNLGGDYPTYVRVRVTYDYNFLVFSLFGHGPSIQIVAKTVMQNP